MHKKIILTLILLICTFVGSAQIKRDYLGFTLGSTSKETVCKFLNDNNISYSVNDNDEYIAQNIKFAGQVWDLVWFSFYNDKLYTIDFSISDMSTPIPTMDIIFQRLCLSLQNKYANYYNNSSTNDKLEFHDDVISITLDYRYFQGIKSLALMYSHMPLMFEKLSSDEDEL